MKNEAAILNQNVRRDRGEEVDRPEERNRGRKEEGRETEVVKKGRRDLKKKVERRWRKIGKIIEIKTTRRQKEGKGGKTRK